MTAPPGSRSLRRKLLACAIASLFALVAGVFAFEWSRPNQVYYGEMASAIATNAVEAKAANQNPTERADAIRRLLLRKWHVTKEPLAFGDIDVEFRDDGTAIRHYTRPVISDKVTYLNYSVTEDGELRSPDPEVTLKLAMVSDDRLCISWNGRSIVEYERGPTVLEKIGQAALFLGALFVILYVISSFSP